MRRAIAVTAVLLAGTGVAFAQEGQVSLGRPDSSTVYVWKDSDAYSEAIKLIGAGVHKTTPELVTRLMACVADRGDHAVVLNRKWGAATILIVDGNNSGCRGAVAIEDVR